MEELCSEKCTFRMDCDEKCKSCALVEYYSEREMKDITIGVDMRMLSYNNIAFHNEPTTGQILTPQMYIKFPEDKLTQWPILIGEYTGQAIYMCANCSESSKNTVMVGKYKGLNNLSTFDSQCFSSRHHFMVKFPFYQFVQSLKNEQSFHRCMNVLLFLEKPCLILRVLEELAGYWKLGSVKKEELERSICLLKNIDEIFLLLQNDKEKLDNYEGLEDGFALFQQSLKLIARLKEFESIGVASNVMDIFENMIEDCEEKCIQCFVIKVDEFNYRKCCFWERVEHLKEVVRKNLRAKKKELSSVDEDDERVRINQIISQYSDIERLLNEIGHDFRVWAKKYKNVEPIDANNMIE